VAPRITDTPLNFPPVSRLFHAHPPLVESAAAAALLPPPPPPPRISAVAAECRMNCGSSVHPSVHSLLTAHGAAAIRTSVIDHVYSLMRGRQPTFASTPKPRARAPRRAPPGERLTDRPTLAIDRSDSGLARRLCGGKGQIHRVLRPLTRSRPPSTVRRSSRQVAGPRIRQSAWMRSVVVGVPLLDVQSTVAVDSDCDKIVRKGCKTRGGGEPSSVRSTVHGSPARRRHQGKWIARIRDTVGTEGNKGSE
jgi:hypothetical protein